MPAFKFSAILSQLNGLVSGEIQHMFGQVASLLCQKEIGISMPPPLTYFIHCQAVLKPDKPSFMSFSEMKDLVT